MKNVLLIVIILLGTNLIAQQNVSDSFQDSNKYFEKYQRQKKAANTLSIS